MRGSYGSRAGRVSIKVHFNQLALFTDDPVDSTPPTIAEVAHDGNDATNGAWREDPQALAGALPADGAGPGAAEPSRPDGAGSAGDDRRPAVRAGVGEENELPGGVGTGDAGMGAAGERERGGDHERGPPAAGEPGRDDKLRDLDPREFSVGDLAAPAPAAPPRDFRIIEAHRIGQG